MLFVLAVVRYGDGGVSDGVGPDWCADETSAFTFHFAILPEKPALHFVLSHAGNVSQVEVRVQRILPSIGAAAFVPAGFVCAMHIRQNIG